MKIMNNYMLNFMESLKNISNSNRKTTSLDGRMRNLITKNNGKFHGFKPFVVTVKSKELSKYINDITEFNQKVELLKNIQSVLFEIGQLIYTRFEPRLVYTFQNEVNIVFFYNDDGVFMYNGNINKMITSIVSLVSIEFYKRVGCQLVFDYDFNFTGQYVEFDIDYEILNYLVWRQLDCKRNTITLLYRCCNKVLDDNHMIGLKLSDMIECLNKQLNVDITEETHLVKLLTGNIIKKYLFYVVKSENDETVVEKCKIGVENFYLSDNFKENYRKYIVNKIL